MLMYNHVEMARVTGVPMGYLLSRWAGGGVDMWLELGGCVGGGELFAESPSLEGPRWFGR